MISHQPPLSMMYDILSLTNSTLLAADMIFLCTKTPVPNAWFSFPFHREMYIRLPVRCHPSHLTSCTPTKSNLYFDIYFTTVMSKPSLYRLLIFHVPNLMSIFLSIHRLSKESIQGPLWHFITPKLEDHTSSAVRYCLFNIFAATLHIWRLLPPSATWGSTMTWWQGTHLAPLKLSM
jgi:hypothetical protein